MPLGSRRRLLAAAAVVFAALTTVLTAGTGNASAGTGQSTAIPRFCRSVRPAAPAGPWVRDFAWGAEITWDLPPDIAQRRTCGPVLEYSVQVRVGDGHCDTTVIPDRDIKDLRFDGAQTTTDYWVDFFDAGWYSFAVTARTWAGWGTRSAWSTPACIGPR